MRKLIQKARFFRCKLEPIVKPLGLKTFDETQVPTKNLSPLRETNKQPLE